MRTRAIRDLAQKSDRDFFDEVATGLDHIARNAIRLEEEVRFLCENRRARGHRILRAVATEEAAKFLILLDAVRCPRRLPEAFSRQLGRFHDHLSKGLYAGCVEWRYWTFGEFKDRIDRERVDFYLDGPNDVDWIFPNEILHTRESTFYVDYVRTDDGHIWLSSDERDRLLETGLPYHEPMVLQLVRSLHAIGFANAAALSVIAGIWRPTEMTLDFDRRALGELNRQTLEALQAKQLLADALEGADQLAIDRWPFPLWSLDLSPIEVDQADLRAMQDERWYREMGVSRDG